jgi:4,5-DOPA dioxygenase extradiol
VLGSGNIVHNLQRVSWGATAEPVDWAVRFDETVKRLLLENELGSLLAYETLGRDAALAVPTPEHYLPLLYVLALRRETDRVSFPVEGIDMGSISMRAVQFS